MAASGDQQIGQLFLAEMTACVLRALEHCSATTCAIKSVDSALRVAGQSALPADEAAQARGRLLKAKQYLLNEEQGAAEFELNRLLSSLKLILY